MNDSNKTYTYRCVEKVELEKRSDQMVVRALPENLDDSAIVSSEQVSSASTRINVSNENLEALVGRNRVIAPTHHAYYDSETGSEFLVTDRIFITFAGTPTDQQVDEFAGRYGLVKKTTYELKGSDPL